MINNTATMIKPCDNAANLSDSFLNFAAKLVISGAFLFKI